MLKSQNLVGHRIKQYTILSKLGKGSNATVYQAINIQTNTHVAIKAIPLKLLSEKPKLCQLVKTQISVLKQCNSKNVIKFVASCKSDKNVFIITQFCNSGDVQDYLNRKGKLTQHQATDFLKQILNGFKGLHQINAMHRDFKLENLLIHNGTIKIADLGFAKQFKQQKDLAKTQLGTFLTMAPEVLDGLAYGMNADIWSLGVIYYQMLYGKYPFMGSSSMDIRNKIKKNNVDFSKQVKISYQSIDFMIQCLIENPNDRITWSQIYSHPLISSKNNLIYSTQLTEIDLRQNRNYYEMSQKKNQIKRQFITDGFDLKKIQSQQQKIGQNFQEIKKKSGDMLKKQKQVFDYGQLLLRKRNNIMFVFRFFLPKISPFLNEINAIHSIALFLMSKQTLIQLQCFSLQIQQKRVLKKQSSCLSRYFQSQTCSKLLSLLKQDSQMLKQQCLSYSQDCQRTNPEILIEMKNFNIWISGKWEELMGEVLERYWFQIAESLDRVQGGTLILIQVLKALQFYMTTDQLSVQVFQKIIETINYQDTKEEIDRKLFSILQ